MHMKSETAGDLDLGLSLKASVLSSVAPGCQLFCSLILVSELFSLPLSYCSASLFR